MLFNSYPFIFLYLPVVFAGMFLVGRYSHRLAALWLGLASLVFYGVWNARFVSLLLTSVAFNYAMGRWIGRRRAAGADVQAHRILVGAVGANLILLGYFKYANFFLATAADLAGTHFPLLNIVLPLGISFFTFTQITFLVDVRRGIAHEYSLINYLLFVTYFPHLIAGPILHHRQMMPQFAEPSTYRMDVTNVTVGLTIFVLGLSKKVLLADPFGSYSTPVFGAVSGGGAPPPLVEAWIGALAYTLQLYFDFSGYSDMAIGLSLMLNIRLPMNFDSPYKATSIIDFWRRWHMTLSAFLRDYLYLPLGGNRKGKRRRYYNLMATMLLGGLWHGAGWTFIIWGGLHGLYLILNHGWRAFKVHRGWRDGGRIGTIGGGALTFIAVVVAWVFFRADSVSSAWSILLGMAGSSGIAKGGSLQPEKVTQLAAICAGLAIVWLLPNVRQMLLRYRPTWEDISAGSNVSGGPRGRLAEWLSWAPTRRNAIVLAVLFILCIDSLSKVSEFLYFQF